MVPAANGGEIERRVLRFMFFKRGNSGMSAI
jgi:hypothetical protein